jgi:hypothetical protein
MTTLEVPGYDVWGLLGEGGMSEVWLAKHRTLAAPVIIKTLRRALRETGQDAERSLRARHREDRRHQQGPRDQAGARQRRLLRQGMDGHDRGERRERTGAAARREGVRGTREGLCALSS